METKIHRKMKKLFYNSGSLLLLAVLLISFSVSAQEVTKEFHKEYNADKTTTLALNNKYGDVVVESWNNNQIVIDVTVSVEVPGRDRAEKLLAMIDVQFSEGTNLISAKTVIDEKFNFSGWSGNKKFRIDYNVRMPEAANLTLANRYGNTEIDKLTGLVNIDIKYGDIAVQNLTRGNEKPLNSVSLSYGKGIIEQAGWLDLYLRYSGSLELPKSQALLVNSRYSKLKIGETSSIVSDSRYDDYNIDKINNFVIEPGYTSVNIGVLTKKLSYQGSYGALIVDEIPSGFESIDVDTKYMGVKLGISGAANYELEGEASYGGIKLDKDRFKYQRQIVNNNSTELSGVVGNEETPASRVKIKASYGSVTLY